MADYEALAQDLLDIKALQIKTEGYFTWASGIQSPIYCDNRLTISYPETRKKITDAFVQMVEELDLKPDVIAGCATGGIPHAAWLADALNLPMVYVRSAPKGHGQGNQIEGAIHEGQKVLVIEDLISTGGSAIEAVNAVRKEGYEILHVLGIFSYGLEKSVKNFAAIDMPFKTIMTFDNLVDVLKKSGEVSEDEGKELIAWRNNL